MRPSSVRGAGRDDNAGALAGGDEGAGERHASRGRRAAASAATGCGALVHRHRLAGQRRFVERRLRASRRRRSAGTRSPGFEQDDIARHDLLGRDGHAVAVAQDGRVRVDHGADRFQRPLGPAFLEKADDRVDHDHGEDNRGIGIMPD